MSGKIRPKKYAPIMYYGGKSNMLKYLRPLIPAHELYVEAFCGGAALFWDKNPSRREVINDINQEVINFYRVVKTKFEELKVEIDCTLSSRAQYDEAREVYNNPEGHSDVKRAWAFWVQTNMSFGNVICGSWAFAKIKQGGSDASNIFWKKQRFEKWIDLRLKNTQIECDDALAVIKRFDDVKTFFYLDPPYLSSDQGHFQGYTLDDFKKLLAILGGIKGKFLLSSYPETLLFEHREKFGWNNKDINKPVSVNNVKGIKNDKCECITWNYNIEIHERNLFDFESHPIVDII